MDNTLMSKISLPGESWAEIYGGRYAVSTFGRVLSLSFKGIERYRLMIPQDVTNYLRVPLYVNGKKKLVLVHRLVATTFVRNPNNFPEVNHKNGNKHDNHIDNLEWVTKSQNKRHSIDVLHRPHPLQGKSMKESCQHKDVEQYTIDGSLVKSYHSIRVAAFETGVNETNISRCANGLRTTAGGYIWKFKKNTATI